MDVDKIGLAARICHETNRAYCMATGDFSQVPWDLAPEWQRDSARKGVEAALRGKGPEALHQSWCDEKVATGWTYGSTKDAERKTHPCLVPYDQLPEEQKRKDHLFRAIVVALTEPV